MCSTSDAQARREIGQVAQFVRHHAQGDGDMSDELAVVRIGEAALVVQLVDLADVVQHHAGKQQVAVDARVVRRHQFCQGAERKHVLDQPAQEGVMNLFGGWGAAVSGGDVRVGQHGFEQRPQVRIGKARRRCRAVPVHISSGSRFEDGK